METSVSLIRLFGPGISLAMRKLEELTIGLMTGKYPELVTKIANGKPYIGEEADYRFHWKEIPKKSELLFLIELLDDSFKDNDAKYTITTHLPETEREDLIYDFHSPKVVGVAYTFLRIYGPSLGEAIRILDTEIAGKIEGIQPDSRGVLIGKYDYVIEWLHIIPTVNEIIELLERIDLALKKSGVTYKITTRSKLKLHTDPRDKDRPKTLQFGAPSPSFSVETGTKNRKT